MGRRGTKTTPTALKIARGNPGCRPLNLDEPDMAAPELTPPAGMKGRALKEWETMGPIYLKAGVLTVGDLRCFETYCDLVAEVERYKQLAAKESPEAALKLGYASHLVKLRGQLKQYLAEIGGTPSSRSGIKAKKPATAGDQRRRRFFGIRSGTEAQA